MNYSSFMQSFLFLLISIGKYSKLLSPAYLSGMLYIVEYLKEIDTICKDEACKV